LKTLLENLGQLDEDMARFYFSEMLLCVEYLHSLGFVHRYVGCFVFMKCNKLNQCCRDLKPGNFVIDKSGHLKLIDVCSQVGKF
jgi:cell cycle protein kinase DBF2